MTFFDRKYYPFILLFAVVLISRLPFLFAGYGIEEDSWAIAISTYLTKTTGIVEPSRLPGHPIHEFPLVWTWNLGHVWFNFLSAFFSAVGALFFALILKHFQFKHYFIAALAFAFIPVYFISSTYTIDFVWSQAFVLIALYLLLKEQLVIAGAFLGLAVGCRITSGAMLLPFMIIVWKQNNLKQNIITLFKLGIPMTLIGVGAFIPIMLQYGKGFFMYYDQFPYPSFAKFIYKYSFGVFGFVGLVAITAAKYWIVKNRKTLTVGELFEKGIDRKVIIASYVVFVLYTISYIRLPQKSGYMIPILPFVILLFGYYLDSKRFNLLAFAFIVSSFVCSINLTDKIRGAEYSRFAIKTTVSGQELFFDVLSGPIFSDYSKRKQKLKYTDSVIESVRGITKKTVVIAGWWYNELEVKMLTRKRSKVVKYEAYIDEQKINEYIAAGYKIMYLPEQNKYNDLMYKMEVTDKLAVPF